jgi:Insertion element 4 transposase N-terminal/Transposase DDE domain
MDLGRELFLASRVAKPEHVGEVCKRLDPEWVEEAVLATGKASLRKRLLPAAQVIWLVIGMALFRNRPIREVVSTLDLVMPGKGTRSLAGSSVVEARSRLGDEPLAWLFSRTADAWAHRSAGDHRWRGLAIYGADGTTLRVPDSAANRGYFGGQAAGAGRGWSGYPQLRMVALMALRSHLIAAVSFGPYEYGENTLAAELWRQVPDASVVVVDRGFFGANILVPLQSSDRNRHWLTRAKAGLKWTVVRRLGRDDVIVEMKVSRSARAKNPALPQTWRMRAIRYQKKGFRAQTLLTSLEDPAKFPAREVVALYHERWELELAYDDVKTEVLEREETLRSQSPTAVSQELLGVLLAHNLVRLEMQRIAALAGVEPLRISFVGALRMIRDEWWWCSFHSPGAIPRHLDDLTRELMALVLPPRRHRSSLRGVKIKMSNYPRIRPGDRKAARGRA